jgi:16S rRNA (adenine1518-N6/adenine1519-N6)-dimethyltransferase
VALSLRFEISSPFSLGPSCFHPRPKVESSFTLLRPRENPPDSDPESLKSLTRACFHSRRKTLFNNLVSAYGKTLAKEALDELGLDGRARPEELPPEAFARLSVALSRKA